MFGELEKLRQRPIPEQGGAREAKVGYRKHPMNSGHPHQSELLLDVREQGIAGVNHYHREDNLPYTGRIPGSIPELYLRSGVVERLARVNSTLYRAGYELFVYDGWRPQAVQTAMHDEIFPAFLLSLRPEWSLEEAQEETSRYWARGARREEDVDPEGPPPHSTGAAVDLTIRRLGGEHLWMGSVFDDCSRRAHTDELELHEDGSISDHVAKLNRRLLHWSMTDEGFVAHPDEWWHFSYGDQLWARLTTYQFGVPCRAHYTATTPP